MRIGHIRQRLAPRKECVVNNPDAHHHIGVAENHPEHIGTFLQVHAGNPAIKVSSHFRLISEAIDDLLDHRISGQS